MSRAALPHCRGRWPSCQGWLQARPSEGHKIEQVNPYNLHLGLIPCLAIRMKLISPAAKGISNFRRQQHPLWPVPLQAAPRRTRHCSRHQRGKDEVAHGLSAQDVRLGQAKHKHAPADWQDLLHQGLAWRQQWTVVAVDGGWW